MTASTAGGQQYAPAQPYHQNSFCILGDNKSENEDSIANAMPTQVAALTYQSQLTHSMATNTGQRQEMQLTQIATNQEAHHATMHQLVDGLTAVAFNISNAGHGIGRFGGRGYAGHGQNGHGRMQGRWCSPPTYIGGFPQGGFPPTMARPFSIPARLHGGFQGDTASGVPPYRPPAASAMNGGYGPLGGYIPRGPPAQANMH